MSAFGTEEDFQKFLLDYDDNDDKEPVKPLVVFKTNDHQEGYDCEDCGYNPTVLDYEEYEDGSCSITTSYGCYGGGQFMHTTKEQAKELLDKGKHLFDDKVVKELEERLTR